LNIAFQLINWLSEIMMMPATTNHILTRTEEHELLQRLAAGEINAFWQIFQQYRDYLFRCCLRWMNGNSTEAEDLLSQAMVKAWEKAQKYAGKIDNFKCWLTTLTRNFWIDLTRRRGANQVEDIEVYGEGDELGLVSVEETPASALDCDEKKRVIRAAIDDLPTRLRETFLLHFYEELSHPEIADRQNITYQNVCKRISQARAILVKELRGYFIGEDGTEPDTANVAAKPAKSQNTAQKAAKVEPILPETVTLSEQLEKEEKTKTGLAATSAGTEPTIEEMSEGNAEVEAIVGESVTLSVAIAEVEGVGGEEPPEVALFELHSESDSVAPTFEGMLEKFNFMGKPIVGAFPPWLHRFGGSQLFHRLRKLVLEVIRGEGCRWCGGDNCMRWGKLRENVRSSPRSPPLYVFNHL
jgi:RNA polymerase sigma factor (sigma-70 family)